MWANLWANIQGPVIQLLATVILAVLGYFTALLIKKITEAQEALKQKTEKELVKAQIDIVGEITKDVVEKIEEETAKYIREAVKDGKVDREELTQLSKQAYNEITQQIGQKGIEILNLSIANVQEYLENLIEQKVREAKLTTEITKDFMDVEGKN